MEVSTDDVPLAQKFEAIEARKHALAISEYTITQTTMDNVFYRFALEQGETPSATGNEVTPLKASETTTETFKPYVDYEPYVDSDLEEDDV